MLASITWTAKPDILMLGNWEVRWYGLFFAIGFYLGYLMVTKMMLKDKGKQEWADSLFVYVIVATVVGARLGHCLFYGWEYYSVHPIEIFKVWEGGLASHGGALGIVVAVWIYSKKVTHRSMLWTFDILVIPTALVAALIRTGNLMNHEVYGVATDLPWGFRFIENVRHWQHGAEPIFSSPSHPTQIYEALCYLATFVLLMTLYLKKPAIKRREGLIFGIFFINIFFTRFLIEFIKNDQEAFEASMSLNMGQWLSIPFVLAGIFFVVRALKKEPVYYDDAKKEAIKAKK